MMKKRLLSILLATLMVVSLLPVTVTADEPGLTVTKVNGDPAILYTDYYYSGNALWITKNGLVVSGTSSSANIMIDDRVSNLKLSNANITAPYLSDAFEIRDSDAFELILEGNNALAVNSSNYGILSNWGTLTISGSGRLSVEGDSYAISTKGGLSVTSDTCTVVARGGYAAINNNLYGGSCIKSLPQGVTVTASTNKDAPEAEITGTADYSGDYLKVGNSDAKAALINPAHVHAAGETYLHNDTHHWFVCSGALCPLNQGETEAAKLAAYEAAFADEATGAALKETLGYAAHDFTGGDCVCGKADPSIPSVSLTIGEYTDKDTLIAVTAPDGAAYTAEYNNQLVYICPDGTYLYNADGPNQGWHDQGNAGNKMEEAPDVSDASKILAVILVSADDSHVFDTAPTVTCNERKLGKITPFNLFALIGECWGSMSDNGKYIAVAFDLLYTSADPAHTHSYGAASYIWHDGLAQCTAYHTCTVDGCGHTELETVSAVTGEKNITATFTKTGFEEQKKPIPTPAHEHTFATTYSKNEISHWLAATCDHTELTKGLADHSFGDGVVDGSKTTYTCAVCGYEKVETAEEPVHVHVPELVSGQTATCTEDGWKDYYRCADGACSKLFSDPACANEIENLDTWKTGDGKIEKITPEEPHTHSYGEATYIWNEDLTECTAYKTCECGHAVIETVNTAISEGNRVADFSEAFVDQTKPVTEVHTHSYGEWIDCGDGLQHKRTCSDCSAVEYANHNYDETVHKCKDCGADEPTASEIKVSVNCTTETQRQFVGFWIFGYYKNVTTYTYTINTETAGVNISKIEYSRDGGWRYIAGKTVTSTMPINSLLIRITDTSGNKHIYKYDGANVIPQ